MHEKKLIDRFLPVLSVFLVLIFCFAQPLGAGAKQENNRSEKIAQQDSGYRGNAKSNVFHSSNCQYYNCKNCTVLFKSASEAKAAGYRPCKLCKPS